MLPEITTAEKIWKSILLSLPILAALPFAPAQDRPPKTVAKVDLKRYAGLWYEIARIPNRFQRRCDCCVTAEYVLRDDGRIDVINRCRRSDGKMDEAKGLARIEDAASNARLKVSFFSILGWRPVWGDYWILKLGEDYDYAVVGAPDRKYGWILARSKELPKEELNEIFDLLREQGYDPDEFRMTRQEGGK